MAGTPFAGSREGRIGIEPRVGPDRKTVLGTRVKVTVNGHSQTREFSVSPQEALLAGPIDSFHRGERLARHSPSGRVGGTGLFLAPFLDQSRMMLEAMQKAARPGREQARSILVVDDDFALRETLCAALEGEGYNVASAGNGQEALDYLRREVAPCLVLLDLMMPVMNGWEFRAEQRRDPKLAGIPVVVLSAFFGAADEELRGVDRLLKKPIDLSVLLEAICSYCP